jgi:hypothetical protein
MPGWAWMLVGLGVAATSGECAGAQPSPARGAGQPYEGVWAASAAACRDADGVDRLSIERNRFFWYETRCRARDVEAGAPRSWTMRMACEGEGQRFSAHPRLSLPTPSKLIMENAPVGPTKRQVYVRCTAKP